MIIRVENFPQIVRSKWTLWASARIKKKIPRGIHALVGEPDQAISLIDRLLSTPGWATMPDIPHSITLAELRLRWEWDPLRSNPRFQKFLAGPEPKTVY